MSADRPDVRPHRFVKVPWQRRSLWRWLSPFPADVVAEVIAAVEDGPGTTRVVGPTDHAVGRRPAAAVRDLLAEVAVAATLPQPSRLVWLADQTVSSAVSLVEAEALFGTLLAPQLIALAKTRDQTSRLVVIGSVRQEMLALMASLGEAPWSQCWAALRAAAPTILLVSRHRATELSGMAGDHLTSLRGLVAAGMGFGADVGATETDAFLADPTGWLDPLRALAGDDAVRSVRFADPDLLDHSAEVDGALARAGLEIDLTWSPAGRPALRPYLPAGAYQPQRHDRRSPAGQWSEGGAVAVVRQCLPDLNREATWASLWARRTRPRIAVLTRLLSYRRKERYFVAVGRDPGLWPSYPEFLVHNWAEPDPAVRVTVVDVGRLGGPAEAALRAAGAWSNGAQPRPISVSHRELRRAARAEARSRASLSARAALADQVNRHSYLAAADPSAPLRQDLADFVEFVPSELGRVLEVGSGFGQLARHLAPRASFYVGLDLVAVGLAATGRGVLADAHHLPFAAAAFDTVVANNSLEHLYDPVTALGEAVRVLRPGGSVLALLPLDFLEAGHRLPAHLWKADQRSVELAAAAVGLRIERFEVIDLATMGIHEAFPSCRGLVAKVDARLPLAGVPCVG